MTGKDVVAAGGRGGDIIGRGRGGRGRMGSRGRISIRGVGI